jgi:Zn-dependent hydrolases, including glyoxylases
MITVKIFEFNHFSELCYLLYDETKEAVIIDCGAFEEYEEKELTDYVTKNGLTIKRLLCTHLHLDHIFGNHFIHKTYGIKPEAHQADVEQLPRTDEQATRFGLGDKVKHIDIESYIIEDTNIKFGHSEIKALLVPGHSPGSIAFYSEKDKFVMSGDALFNGSIGRTDLWGGSQSTLTGAIKEKLLTLPDDTIVYPGHGPQTTIAKEKLYNPFL